MFNSSIYINYSFKISSEAATGNNMFKVSVTFDLHNLNVVTH